MSNVEAWIRTLVDHADYGIRLAKSLGLGELLPDEIDKVKAALSDKLDEVLPLAIVGVAVSAIGVAAKVEHDIASLGASPRCPNGHIATQHIEKQVDGPGTVKLTCSECSWTLP